MTAISNFNPPPWLQNQHVQTLLVSSLPRRIKVRRQSREFRKHSQKELVCTPQGVRLLAERALAKSNKPSARVILLHGWEGSSDSNYMLGLGTSLWDAGFEIIRLNLRDHGDSHYLNKGIFHSCLLQEVVEAIRILCDDSEVPVFLIGFSLGGNFMLRVACQAHEFKHPPQHVYAISPALIPSHVMRELDEGWSVYHNYFRKKWRRSLRKKQSVFPETYNFDDWMQLDELGQMTAELVDDYTEFADVEAYFEGYSVGGDYLASLQVATSIITATDDPVIPVADFQQLPDNPNLNIEILPHGGHCGFIENLRLHSWLEHELPARINRELDHD